MKKIALLILVGLLILVFGVVPAWTSSLTRYIPDDNSIGTWDKNTRTYTLTTDVYQTIVIDKDNLTLDGAGHTITGSGWGNGVYLCQRSNVTVKNCVFSKFHIGILLFIGSSNTLTNNITNDNSYGIYLHSGSSNTLTNNITNDNNRYGIYLDSCSSNTLTKNTIYNNQSGIKLYNCNLNKVYNNNFINNPTQAIVNKSSSNEFYLNKPVGGNYWSNWTNPNDDGDYFVDYSYGFFYGRDYFPWICQDGWKRPIADAGDDKKVLVGETVQFDGSGSYDTDGIIVAYEWIFGDGTNGSGMIVNHIYDEADIYTVTLVISDDGGFKGTDTAEIIIQTPAEAIGDLITTIESFGLPKGIEKSLIALLKAAIKSLEKYQEQAVIGQLTGFIHHVEAQNDKKLTKEQAQMLLVVAQRIINSIQ